MKNLEIISIGNELLSGFTVNTNAAWLGQRCKDLGIHVSHATTVTDNKQAIQDALKTASMRANFVIVTGGLGPTHDDVTKNAIIELTKMKLIFSEETLEKIRTLFETRGVQMPETNREQAMVLSDAKIIPNPIGTAPGFDFSFNKSRVFVLPGVPSEMMKMFHNTIEQDISDPINTPKILFVRTTGISESRLFEILGDLPSMIGNINMAYLPKHTGVDLRFEINGNNDSIYLLLKQLLEIKIGSYIYAWNNQSLAHSIVHLLKNRQQTLSLAESCTGGMIASQIVKNAGSSEIFKLGVVSYHNDSKEDILHVSEEYLQNFGAVSKEVAEEMAVNVRMRGGTDFGISVTGIAGPSGGTIEKPIGSVYIGLAFSEGCETKHFQFGKNRQRNRERAAMQALNMLRMHCLDHNDT